MNATQTAQHTPGPWTLEPTGQGVRWNRAGYITSADGKVCVGYAYSDKTKMHVGEADANGVLMAAAPDLLAACKAAQKVLSAMQETDRGYIVAEELGMIRAAIAKAEKGEGA